MGGEWNFKFDGDKSTFDLKSYQNLLINIYETYKNITDWGNDGNVQWSEGKPPADNVFANFIYKCTRHSWHNGIDQRASWKLLWDPTTDNNVSDVHARCATHQFKQNSLEIQEMICKSFQKHFLVYLGDGVSGCGEYEWDSRIGTYDYGSDSYLGPREELDMTACDKECGYCGACWY